MKTKHSWRRCTTCRDYAIHEKAVRGPGNWTAKLGTVHLAKGPFPPACYQLACGRRRPPRALWAVSPALVTCKICRRVARARRPKP